jgi:hypothetical protein
MLDRSELARDQSAVHCEELAHLDNTPSGQFLLDHILRPQRCFLFREPLWKSGCDGAEDEVLIVEPFGRDDQGRATLAAREVGKGEVHQYYRARRVSLLGQAS